MNRLIPFYITAFAVALFAGFSGWYMNSMALINNPQLLCVLEGRCPELLKASPAFSASINMQLEQALQKGADTVLVNACKKILSKPNELQLKLQQLCDLNTIVASNDKRRNDKWIFTVIANPATRDTVKFYYTQNADNITVDSITGIANLMVHTTINMAPTSQ